MRDAATKAMADFRHAERSLSAADDELADIQTLVQQASLEKADHEAMRLGAQATSIGVKLKAIAAECGDDNVPAHLKHAMDAVNLVEPGSSSGVSIYRRRGPR